MTTKISEITGKVASMVSRYENDEPDEGGELVGAFSDRLVKFLVGELREPTATMTERGANLVPDRPVDDEGEAAADIWRAMIDALLNE